MAKRKRYCFNCGEEIEDSAYYDPLDTCGSPECERQARYAREAERSEAHEQLDRDLGWY